MACTAASTRTPAAARAAAPQTPAFGRLPARVQQRSALAVRRPVEGQQIAQSRRAVQTQAATELFQLADTAGFISGTAATMFAMTLVGLAIGFVLLRVESLVEEGKI